MSRFFRFIDTISAIKFVFISQIFIGRFFLKCKIIFFKLKYLLFQIKVFRHKRRIFLLNRKYQSLNFKYFGGKLPVFDATTKLGSKINNVLYSTHSIPPLTKKSAGAQRSAVCVC